MCEAASALPYHDRERAIAGLRGQLRIMAATADATPDWVTLTDEGPTEAPGLHGATWIAWTATVETTDGCAAR
jgi:hypothetical protein